MPSCWGWSLSKPVAKGLKPAARSAGGLSKNNSEYCLFLSEQVGLGWTKMLHVLGWSSLGVPISYFSHQSPHTWEVATLQRKDLLWLTASQQGGWSSIEGGGTVLDQQQHEAACSCLRGWPWNKLSQNHSQRIPHNVHTQWPIPSLETQYHKSLATFQTPSPDGAHVFKNMRNLDGTSHIPTIIGSNSENHWSGPECYRSRVYLELPLASELAFACPPLCQT